MTMNIDFSPLDNHPRLLIEAALAPVQGTRFQATGFPEIGTAEYPSPDGNSRIVLVESAQSMANRLENVCWDMTSDDWITPLKGLPLVKVKDAEGKAITNSVLEAHRLNSEYIARNPQFRSIADSEIGFRKDRSFDVRIQLAPFLLKYDPNSIIHGIFFEEIGGVLRLPRLLSGFIEAEDIKVASSGGVKINRVEPGLKGGEGNVIFSRDEYVSPKIVAYFNLDMAQLRGYGFSNTANNLLVAWSLFKIRRFLEHGLRLRTACDFEVRGEPIVTRPAGFSLPSLGDLGTAMPELIQAVRKERLFADVTAVVYSADKTAKKKKSESNEEIQEG